MKFDLFNLTRQLMRSGFLAAAISLAGCGGTDDASNQDPLVESSQAGHSQALAASRKGTERSEADSVQDVVRGNGLYLTLSKDGHSILKSNDGVNWQVAFTHDKRKFRELSFEDGTFVARTRRVRFLSSDPLAAVWTRDKAVYGRKHKDAIANSYMVMYDEDAAIEDIAKFTRDLETQVNSSGGDMHVKSVYKLAGPGFSATMSEASLEILRNNPAVAYVQQSFKMHFIEPISSKPADPVAEAMAQILASGSQATPSSIWNLDRIDQETMPLDGQYKYQASGKGVHAYIWDTGIRKSHSEFSGKAFGAGMSASPCDYGHWHGTHVAGTVGGKTYGVAKDVTLHNIFMSGCDTEGGIFAGVDVIEFVMADVKSHGGRGVVNMSFGGLGSYGPSAWNDALTNATNAGIVFVAAAGNSGADPVVENRDACNMWPAQHPSVIAVGSYGRTNQARSWFSNMGSCITLFAPGEEILSADTANDTAIVGAQGTSMAAPHVVGAVAIYLEMNPTAPVSDVKNALIAASSKNVIRASDLGAGSPNRLLNINFPTSGGSVVITASAGANGSISPSGDISVAKGSNQTFTISPAASYVVNAVTVDGVNVGAVTSYTFSNVQAAHSISASFKAATVSISATAGANGSISPSGNVSVAKGSNQTFTITPASNYVVNAVTVDSVNVGEVTSYTFSNVQAAHSISASFKQANPPSSVVISASAGANGSISPSGSVSVTKGSSKTFAITPATGYAIATVTVDGVRVGAPASYTFSNVQAAHTISATFKSTSTSGPVGYIKCANEWRTCTLSGTNDVAYGANGKFYYKTNVVGSIGCNNSTFGDPIVGTVKACYYKPKATSIAPGAPSEYSTKCANEHGTCTFSGTRNVAYGANGKFSYKTNVTGSIACNNATFGDPIVGTYKACYYQ